MKGTGVWLYGREKVHGWMLVGMMAGSWQVDRWMGECVSTGKRPFSY